MGTVIDNFTEPLGGRRSYVIPLGMIYIVPGLLSIGLFFIPESPRWLLQMQQTEKARAALRWLRPMPNDIVDAELDQIKTAIDLERDLSQNTEILDIWRNPIDRRRTLLAIGGVSLQAASGAIYMICEQILPMSKVMIADVA